jgi:uncharacterized protein with NRDE domain
VPRFLLEDREPGAFLQALRADADRFAGFNLLLGDSSTLHYYSNAIRQPPRALPPGIYGLSNHQLDEPWPKLVRTRQRFAAELVRDDPAPETLFDVLADRAPAADGLPATGLPADLERALSPIQERTVVSREMDDLVAKICQEARSGDQILVMSNGGFSGIHDRLLRRLDRSQ